MQKALTPVSSQENDCFADDAVEEPEEADTPLQKDAIFIRKHLILVCFSTKWHQPAKKKETGISDS